MKWLMAQSIMLVADLNCAVDKKADSGTSIICLIYVSPGVLKQLSKKCGEAVSSCTKSEQDFLLNFRGMQNYVPTDMRLAEIVFVRAGCIS